jgi:hypothetical protein
VGQAPEDEDKVRGMAEKSSLSCHVTGYSEYNNDDNENDKVQTADNREKQPLSCYWLK